jgi:transcriptional regulator with XRE-family HTH domain
MRIKDGDNFRRIIAEKGLTQAGIARSAGLGKGFLSMLISGDRGCTAETAQLIVHALEPTELTVDALFITRIHGSGASLSRGPRSAVALPESA